MLSSEFEAVFEEGDGDVVTTTVMGTQLAATSKVSVGPIIVLGVAIVILAALAFAFVTTARRKKRPSECAEQRGALESAERALHYWEAAAAHLRVVDLEGSAHSGTGATGAAREFKYGHTDDMTGQEFAELLKRAVDARRRRAVPRPVPGRPRALLRRARGGPSDHALRSRAASPDVRRRRHWSPTILRGRLTIRRRGAGSRGWAAVQWCSGTMSIAPHGHSLAQIPQPLQ